MNILILGSGGREHTFTWKIAQSSRCEKLFVAPGNAGTSKIAENVALDILDFETVGQFVLQNGVSLVVVGPEAPLVAGIVDYFKADKKLKKVGIIGPSAKGAMLEGSKDFSKDFMRRHGVPTASSKTFAKESITEGLAFLDSENGPYVLKADGLAAGKGVIITENREEAKSTLNEMLLEAKFGDASSKVVIEQYL
ncbi:MAG: phosphoribosylamine--glycine ligase, partial [Algoriphagus sp.]